MWLLSCRQWLLELEYWGLTSVVVFCTLGTTFPCPTWPFPPRASSSLGCGMAVQAEAPGWLQARAWVFHGVPVYTSLLLLSVHRWGSQKQHEYGISQVCGSEIWVDPTGCWVLGPMKPCQGAGSDHPLLVQGSQRGCFWSHSGSVEFSSWACGPEGLSLVLESATFFLMSSSGLPPAVLGHSPALPPPQLPFLCLWLY